MTNHHINVDGARKAGGLLPPEFCPPTFLKGQWAIVQWAKIIRWVKIRYKKIPWAKVWEEKVRLPLRKKLALKKHTLMKACAH